MKQQIRVMQSFGNSRSTTNPYITMLGQSLERTPNVELLRFSWRTALSSNYDVFHFHWPEALLAGKNRWTRTAKKMAFFLLLARLRLRRTAIIRTLHNLEQPSGLPFLSRRLLATCSKMTSLCIVINSAPPAGQTAPTVFIPHGHYVDWFKDIPKSDSLAGRLAFTGLIRRYKGVEDLVRTFAQTAETDPHLSLSVTGNPSSRDIVDEIDQFALGDPRIRATYGYVSEETLVASITAAELVVLPYRFMHNSGSVLAALSLERPVLVPRNTVNELLSEEVGSGWIYMYEDALTAQDLITFSAQVHSSAADNLPDLSARSWDRAGQQHLDAYRRAVESVKNRGHKSRSSRAPS